MMTASTITETTALHGRKRLRSREEKVEVLPKDSHPTLNNEVNSHDAVQTPSHSIIQESKNSLRNLYSSSTEAKIWGVAAKGLRQPSPQHSSLNTPGQEVWTTSIESLTFGLLGSSRVVSIYYSREGENMGIF
jgi:hypothetical protein